MSDFCIQIGHQDIVSNDLVHLRGATGAPNELQFNETLADKLALRLRDLGHSVTVTDANYHAGIYEGVDYDLFVSLHYDSYSPGKDRGCRFSAGDFDHVREESQRMVDILIRDYPGATGIPLYRNNQTTLGMRQYYGFNYPSRPTPAVIIECGVGHHPEDRPILTHDNGDARQGIAEAIALAMTTFAGGGHAELPLPEDHQEPAVGPTNYQMKQNREAAFEQALQIAQQFEPMMSDQELARFHNLRDEWFKIVSGTSLLMEWE